MVLFNLEILKSKCSLKDLWLEHDFSVIRWIKQTSMFWWCFDILRSLHGKNSVLDIFSWRKDVQNQSSSCHFGLHCAIHMAIRVSFLGGIISFSPISVWLDDTEQPDQIQRLLFIGPWAHRKVESCPRNSGQKNHTKMEMEKFDAFTAPENHGYGFQITLPWCPCRPRTLNCFQKPKEAAPQQHTIHIEKTFLGFEIWWQF